MLTTGFEMEVASQMFPSFKKRPRINVYCGNDPPANLHLRIRLPDLPNCADLSAQRAHVNAVLTVRRMSSHSTPDSGPSPNATAAPGPSPAGPPAAPEAAENANPTVGTKEGGGGVEGAGGGGPALSPDGEGPPVSAECGGEVPIDGVHGGGIIVIEEDSVAPDGLDPPDNLDNAVLREHVVRLSPQSDSFQTFAYVFHNDRDYRICIKLLLVKPLGSSSSSSSPSLQPAREEPIGMLETRLSDVLAHGHLDASVRRLGGPRVEPKTAELALEWLHNPDERMVFDIQIAVNQSAGWPFSTARPFFILYRWEQPLTEWTPIYRSEVLTHASHTPDGQRCMVFRLASQSIREAIGDDNCPLRIEFFHYKLASAPRLIGSVSTSLAELRQLRPSTDVKLILNVFPKGELVGKLKLTNSRITSLQSYFALSAEFGGHVESKFLYFVISLSDPRRRLRGTRFREPLVFYTISQYTTRGQCDELLRTKMHSRQRGSTTHLFNVSKLNHSKLNSDHNSASGFVQFTLYSRTSDRKRRGEGTEIGQFETRLDQMLSASPHRKFPLVRDELAIGHVRICQAQKFNGRMCFDMMFELGDDEDSEESDSIDESSAE